MFYVGLDVHTKQVTICVLDQDGKVVKRAQVRQLNKLERYLKGLKGPFDVCYEASCGYGCYYELLEPIARRVVVAHAGMLKLIFLSKQKNDRRDAEKLAKLLYLPTSGCGQHTGTSLPRGHERLKSLKSILLKPLRDGVTQEAKDVLLRRPFPRET